MSYTRVGVPIIRLSIGFNLRAAVLPVISDVPVCPDHRGCLPTGRALRFGAGKRRNTIILIVPMTGIVTVARYGTSHSTGNPVGDHDFEANLKDQITRLTHLHHKDLVFASHSFAAQGMISRSPFGFKVNRRALKGVKLSALAQESIEA